MKTFKELREGYSNDASDIKDVVGKVLVSKDGRRFQLKKEGNLYRLYVNGILYGENENQEDLIMVANIMLKSAASK